MSYNYYEAVKEDIRNYIDENIEYTDFYSIDKLEEYLNDELYIEDSVTGNASGSYTFNAYEAERNLCHNLGLLSEALDEAGFSGDFMATNGAEVCDVLIRCHILNECISEVLDEIEEDFYEAHEEAEAEWEEEEEDE